MDSKELKERQGWTLDQKIDHSIGVINQFYVRTDGKCYISFSGGKDSTILLHLARRIFPDIRAVFCNTRNEYPDIIKFVRSMTGIEIIYPELKPKEVFEKWGFPLISKDLSNTIYLAKYYPDSKRAKQALGLMQEDGAYSHEISNKWKYLLYESYKVSDRCCSELKKKPMKRFEHETGLSPILGIMASESKMREKTYIRQGQCNSFNGKRLVSNPLSIWMERDIYDYIDRFSVPVSDIYKNGATRTGCMFCGFGCQFKADNRLQLCYDLYPKMYDLFLEYTNNGVTYREAMRKLLNVNGLCLPDEKPIVLLDIYKND